MFSRVGFNSPRLTQFSAKKIDFQNAFKSGTEGRTSGSGTYDWGVLKDNVMCFYFKDFHNRTQNTYFEFTPQELETITDAYKACGGEGDYSTLGYEALIDKLNPGDPNHPHKYKTDSDKRDISSKLKELTAAFNKILMQQELTKSPFTSLFHLWSDNNK